MLLQQQWQTLVQLFAHLLLRSVTFLINLPGESWETLTHQQSGQINKNALHGNLLSESSSLLSSSRCRDMIDGIR